jgi:hypothetical protein
MEIILTYKLRADLIREILVTAEFRIYYRPVFYPET